MCKLFNNIYKNRSVFLTGHTGFKGSWLSLWLCNLGAHVTGYSRQSNTSPNHLGLLDIKMHSIIGDILDSSTLCKSMQNAAPQIVFHLAAQPLVRDSYENPIETYSSNVLGTMNVLEAARKISSVKAVVVITTDKVYENQEWHWGYRENERLGGYDPYSSSKACVEILCNSYRNSFWNVHEYGKSHDVLMSTVRAGNVIGGGDWSKDRLIPDIVKSTISDTATIIRNPMSTRPWQHVLDCLSGYLLVGKLLLENKKESADSFNFGPSDTDELPVKTICDAVKECWPKVKFEFPILKEQPHEAGLLKLDCTKAKKLLQWKPFWNSTEAIRTTINWYRDFYESKRITSQYDLDKYVENAIEKGAIWAKQF